MADYSYSPAAALRGPPLFFLASRTALVPSLPLLLPSLPLYHCSFGGDGANPPSLSLYGYSPPQGYPPPSPHLLTVLFHVLQERPEFVSRGACSKRMFYTFGANDHGVFAALLVNPPHLLSYSGFESRGGGNVSHTALLSRTGRVASPMGCRNVGSNETVAPNLTEARVPGRS